VVDDGDLLNEEEELPESVLQSAKLKADTIVQAFKYIGIDAANVGELDLVLGIDYLKELGAKRDFPFISANLVDDKDTPIFKRYVIKQVNGKNVGIFGVIGDTSEMVSKITQITNGAAKVQDPLQAAESVIKELSGKVDYVIALAHQGTNRDWVLARRVKGIDLIVGGHDNQKTREPYDADGTLIVLPGEKNQYQGMLEVTFGETKTSQNKLVPLGGDIPDDPKVKAMITKYNDDVTALYSTPSESKPAEANVELRLAACESCHAEMVTKWKTTDHAKAYQTLVSKSKQYDPKCLMCHTTRFEQPDGFSMKQQQMNLIDVQCETCHGYAEKHMSDITPVPTAKPSIDLCIKCHTPDRCPSFREDAQVVMEKIKHWHQ
jgi:2',3'-cyclic-nucleotide 2'-phosphodiesterase (5'-nucleotidase family)